MEYPKHTTLEEDLENLELIASIKKERELNDALASGKITKTDIALANRVNELINFDNNVNEQIALIEKTDEFVNYDEKGKDIVEGWCKIQIDCITLKRSKIDSKASWDILIQLNGEKLLTEIKMRKFNHTYYDEWFIQDDKYKKVTELADKYNYKPVYCNIFTDEQMLLWNMEIIKNKEIQIHQMNKTKMGDDTKINKNIYGLKNNEAFLITTIKN